MTYLAPTVRFLSVSVTLFFLPACSGQGVAKPTTHPARVLLIRHAEKPDDVLSLHLSEAGKKRAEELPKLFEKTDKRPDPFPKPDFLFTAKNTSNSRRPAETVAPLAEVLHLKVNHDFDHHEPAAFAKALFASEKYAGKTVLICWHHGSIGELAKALGVEKPPEWKDDAFDRVWDLIYDTDGKVTFKNRPMHLMPGDAKK